MKISNDTSLSKLISTLVAALLTAALSWCSGPTPANDADPPPVAVDRPAVVEAVVEHVSDGDTVIFRLGDGTEERARLIGIDAPESTSVHVTPEPWGKEASEYAKTAMPEGSTVYLELGVEEERDQYGRLFAWVWLERPDSRDESEIRDKMYNARIVIDGLAENFRKQQSSPYKDLFRDFEAEAREAGRGMWSGETPRR